MVVLLRMAPFVERNFNLVELGPRGTGKSHLFQQISPYSHLISGGKATAVEETSRCQIVVPPRSIRISLRGPAASRVGRRRNWRRLRKGRWMSSLWPLP